MPANPVRLKAVVAGSMWTLQVRPEDGRARFSRDGKPMSSGVLHPDKGWLIVHASEAVQEAFAAALAVHRAYLRQHFKGSKLDEQRLAEEAERKADQAMRTVMQRMGKRKPEGN